MDSKQALDKTQHYRALFERRLAVRRGSRWQKLSTIPVKLAYSNLLKAIARGMDISIPHRARTFWDAPMLVVYPEGMSTGIYQYGFIDREEALIHAMLHCLRPGMVVLDVGAHFGFFSLLAAQLVGAQGQVHAFEPTPSTFSILQRNAQTRPNIYPSKRAAWSHDTTLTFHDYGLLYSGYNSFFAPRLDARQQCTTAAAQEHTVQTISIDAYSEMMDIKPDFIKIDAESAEAQILCGMERTLCEVRPLVTMEIGDMQVDGAAASRTLLRHFHEREYRVFAARAGRFVPHEFKEAYDFENAVLVPREHEFATAGQRI